MPAFVCQAASPASSPRRSGLLRRLSLGGQQLRTPPPASAFAEAAPPPPRPPLSPKKPSAGQGAPRLQHSASWAAPRPAASPPRPLPQRTSLDSAAPPPPPGGGQQQPGPPLIGGSGFLSAAEGPTPGLALPPQLLHSSIMLGEPPPPVLPRPAPLLRQARAVPFGARLVGHVCLCCGKRAF